MLKVHLNKQIAQNYFDSLQIEFNSYLKLNGFDIKHVSQLLPSQELNHCIGSESCPLSTETTPEAEYTVCFSDVA